MFSYAKSFIILGYYWYNHRVGRDGSITTSYNVKRTLDVIKIAADNISYTNTTLNIAGRIIDIINNYVMNIYQKNV